MFKPLSPISDMAVLSFKRPSWGLILGLTFSLLVWWTLWAQSESGGGMVSYRCVEIFVLQILKYTICPIKLSKL